MAEFFVISHHHPTVSPAQLERRVVDQGGCFTSLHVLWHHLLVLGDGSRTLAHLSAPDAESARIALRNAEFAVDDLWPVRRLDGGSGEPDTSAIVAMTEWHSPHPLADNELEILPSCGRQSQIYLSLSGSRLTRLCACDCQDACGSADGSLLTQCRQVTTCLS